MKVNLLPLKIMRALGTLFFIILLLASFTPFISTYAGLVAGFFAVLLYLLLNKKKNIPKIILEYITESHLKRWFKLSVFSVFWGIFVYSGCYLYSESRVNNLKKECKEQKNIIFNIKSNTP